jgi:hypothetical protein
MAGDPELDPPQEDRMKAVEIAPHAAAHRIRFPRTIQPSSPKDTLACREADHT